jgi:hypothetical protein
MGVVEKSKGCHLFACNEPTRGVPLCLCMAIKKKNIIVCKWDAQRRIFAYMTELGVPTTVKSMSWVGASVCVGIKKEYSLIHVATGATIELFQVNSKRSALALTLLPNKEVLLTRDSTGVSIGYDGNILRSDCIQWEDCPTALAYSHPYVIALTPNNVEIRHFATGTLAQRIPFKNAHFVAQKDAVFVASQTSLRKMTLLPLQEQVRELVSKKMFQEALSLVDQSRDEDWPSGAKERTHHLSETHTRYAYHLFNQAKYQEAMYFFQQSKCDPKQIISLFTEMLPSGQCEDVKHPTAVKKIQEENLLLVLKMSLLSHVYLSMPASFFFFNCKTSSA